MNPSGTLLSPPTQALGIAFAARKIARRPSDQTMTFGYVRAEVVAAYINDTTLIVVGLYLVYEAVMRFIAPQPVQGWLIVIIAAIALIVDVITALLTYAMSKSSMNIRAAFLHNVADALEAVHHVHVWAIDEQQNALEAHVVTKREGDDAKLVGHLVVEAHEDRRR